MLDQSFSGQGSEGSGKGGGCVADLGYNSGHKSRYNRVLGPGHTKLKYLCRIREILSAQILPVEARASLHPLPQLYPQL